MTPRTNHSLSVDCVVFGFDGTALKVLLIERPWQVDEETIRDYKLPGSLIHDEEDLPTSAARALEELTGLGKIKLKQFNVFSDPHRVTGRELQWLNEYYGVNTTRVVTVAYYALVKLDKSILHHTRREKAIWDDVQVVRKLAIDHKMILSEAMTKLNEDLIKSPAAFDLLPRKFTLKQLHDLYSIILGIEIDSRNFRKKILASGFIVPTGEKEQGVAHKPAQYYTFDKNAYKRETKPGLGLINWRV